MSRALIHATDVSMNRFWYDRLTPFQRGCRNILAFPHLTPKYRISKLLFRNRLCAERRQMPSIPGQMTCSVRTFLGLDKASKVNARVNGHVFIPRMPRLPCQTRLHLKCIVNRPNRQCILFLVFSYLFLFLLN